MKLAIMQPYLFPYIGYFQLIHAVDTFVIYDDVQFIKEGWIHRNRLLINKRSNLFTLPLKKDNYRARINDRFLAMDRWEKERAKILTTIRQSYGKAPYFCTTFPLVKDCLSLPTENLSEFIEHTITSCCEYLGITTKLVTSSSLDIDSDLTAQDRVLAICKTMNADAYLNAVGGQDLYSKETFAQAGTLLSFIHAREIIYPQFNNAFVPWLSIIDVMMFNPLDKIKEYLEMYDLV